MTSKSKISFSKYQSLGNDFIIIDSTHQPLNSTTICQLCDRHYGIGADGILFISRQNQQANCNMYNSDGTLAEKCLNGLRCAAHYLYSQHNYPAKFKINMHNSSVPCAITPDELITLTIDDAKYQQEIAIDFTGHMATVGNPHFVICQPTTTTWLQQHGHTLATNSIFPQQSNIEFIWEIPAINNQQTFQMLVYERGCGVTLACGSGAAAAITVLANLQQIQPNTTITIQMAGGNLQTSIDKAGIITQQAPATLIYQGSIEPRDNPNKPGTVATL